MTAWTDAALLNAAGIPAICFGPGDIALAHAAEEYIEVYRDRTARPRASSCARTELVQLDAATDSTTTTTGWNGR